ncbi:MAG: siroheme synthase CysG [Pseudomonadota bacterium]
MRYFPTFMQLRERRVLVAGGGETALRKGRLLAKAGADLVFVAPAMDADLIAAFPSAAFIKRGFEPDDLSGARLVFAANDDEELDRSIVEAARAAGVPANAVDQPDLCDFITPSIVDRGDVVVAISTAGSAPVLGRSLRARIEALLPQRMSDLAALARAFRPAVAARIAGGPARRRFWERVFSGPVAERALAGDAPGAREAMVRALNAPQTEDEAGVVHIVGAGPGDPELLTLKALRILQEADVVLHDNLVDDAILELVRRDADRIYVGKKKSDHSLPQSEIGELMIRLAQEGKRVVRLKGGDPFVFGRGGEELEALRAAGVDAFVVPGVTAALGCAAETGAPLTHRDHAQSVTFVTGHAAGGGSPDIDWAALASPAMTLVFYMSVSTADDIARNLIAHGRAGSTPVAIVENGSRANQKIVKGALRDLPGLVKAGEVKGPAIVLVGDVAQFADGRGLLDLVDQSTERPAAIFERAYA